MTQMIAQEITTNTNMFMSRVAILDKYQEIHSLQKLTKELFENLLSIATFALKSFISYAKIQRS